MSETEKEIMEMFELIKSLPADVRKEYVAYLRTLVTDRREDYINDDGTRKAVY